MSICGWIDKWAERDAGRTAIRYEGRDITYGRLAGDIARLAGGLHRLGVTAGERVAYLGYNRPEMLVLLFACARLGAMLVPLNWRLTAPEHRFILENAGAKWLLAEPGFADHIAAMSPLDPALICAEPGACPQGWTAYDELMAAAPLPPGVTPPETALLIVYTSGTTGRPKGAVLSQDALRWNALNSLHAHGMSAADHILTTLPMFHVGGLNIQTTPALFAGAKITLHAKFEAAPTLRALVADRPTLALLVPAQMQAIAALPAWAEADLSGLRLLTTGSSVVPPAVIEPWLRRAIPVIMIYGATETAPIAIHTHIDDALAATGSTGKAAKHCDIRLLGPNSGKGDPGEVPAGARGEVLVRGPNVMSGYWRDPAATAGALRDGWLHTGDIAYRDATGNYHIVDRAKDMIVSGGENIYPAEVEAVLYRHPDVAEAAVVAVADGRWGEAPVAVVAPRPGRVIAEPELRALCEAELARYKHPRDIIFTDALPHNAMGKILKYRLREMLRDGELGAASETGA